MLRHNNTTLSLGGTNHLCTSRRHSSGNLTSPIPLSLIRMAHQHRWHSTRLLHRRSITCLTVYGRPNVLAGFNDLLQPRL